MIRDQVISGWHATRNGIISLALADLDQFRGS
jgi:hypothetical protein